MAEQRPINAIIRRKQASEVASEGGGGAEPCQPGTGSKSAAYVHVSFAPSY